MAQVDCLRHVRPWAGLTEHGYTVKSVMEHWTGDGRSYVLDPGEA